MRGLIEDFIQRMDSESNSQSSYGLKVTHQELRELGKKHLTTYGEAHVEELVHYLDELAKVIHPKAKFAVRLAAEGLQRRLAAQKAREVTEQKEVQADLEKVFNALIELGAVEIDLEQ